MAADDAIDWSDVVMARVVRMQSGCAKCGAPATAIVSLQLLTGQHFIAMACDKHAEQTIDQLRSVQGMREINGTFANETAILGLARCVPDLLAEVG